MWCLFNNNDRASGGLKKVTSIDERKELKKRWNKDEWEEGRGQLEG